MNKIISICFLMACLNIVSAQKVDAKSFLVKTKVTFQLDRSTNEESEKKESYVYFEFDPEIKKTIEITQEGRTFIVNIIKYEINKEGDLTIFNFWCDKDMMISFAQSSDKNYQIVHIVLSGNPIAVVYASE